MTPPTPDPQPAQPAPPEASSYAFWLGMPLHLIPWLTCVADLWATDLALEKSHAWYMGIPVLFYIPFNYYISQRNGNAITFEKDGSVYFFESWNDHPVYSVFAWIILGALPQIGLFYCSASCVERCCPKRPEEEYDLALVTEQTGDNENKGGNSVQ